MSYNKIHIIGGPGSGKTFAAGVISKKLSIPSYDLDELFWDRKAGDYHTKTTEEARSRLLAEILKTDKWVIEGVYYKWLEDSFNKTDIIIILQTPLWLRNWRVMLRFIKRKSGLIKAKRESFSDFMELIKWNNKFDTDNMNRIKAFLQKNSSKIIQIKTKRQLKLLIEK